MPVVLVVRVVVAPSLSRPRANTPRPHGNAMALASHLEWTQAIAKLRSYHQRTSPPTLHMRARACMVSPRTPSPSAAAVASSSGRAVGRRRRRGACARALAAATGHPLYYYAVPTTHPLICMCLLCTDDHFSLFFIINILMRSVPSAVVDTRVRHGAAKQLQSLASCASSNSGPPLVCVHRYEAMSRACLITYTVTHLRG